MDVNVLIIGTGLFGCHAAITLKNLGIQFKIADITNDFFQGSSSKNQNRLHQGFHYARSYSTRHECIKGYYQFIKTYPFAAKDISKNLYFIDRKSIIDFHTYKHIFKHENIPFNIVNKPELPFDYNIDAFDGNGDAFLTSEKFIDFNELRQFFINNLSKSMIKNYDPIKLHILYDNPETSAVYNDECFTHLIDCTYFQMNMNIHPKCNVPNIFYELCISFLYNYQDQQDDDQSFAFTVMDGPFFSIYPYDIKHKIYSLTDVVRTPLIKTKDISEVYTLQKNLDNNDIQNIKQDFENNIIKYIPDFCRIFKYHSYYLSIKTKPNLQSDDRSLIYINSGNIHRFSGGKLTGIFPMEEKLHEIFKISDVSQ